MSIEHAILGLLSLAPLSGYDLKKMFEGSAALAWSGNNNQIYTTLVKLHHQGWVSREVQTQEASPTRKVYSLTAQGLAELRSWVMSAPEIPQVKNSFLIQLAWADLLTADELDQLLARYASELEIQLKMLNFQKERLNLSPSGVAREAYINLSLARTPRETFLWKMVLENWSAYYQAELNWVGQLRSTARQF